jgi:Plasmid recombination enzyme
MFLYMRKFACVASFLTSSLGFGRALGQEHTYEHADAGRRHLNKTYMATEHCRLPLEQAISRRIQEGYSGKKEIRKDAIKYMTTIFTGTHERMTELARDPQLLDKWVQANYAFACKEFGKANIVRFVLHMDEKTPHLHCVTVPLTQDGRLSAKEIMGNLKALQDRQDRYAVAMEPFGLVRGIRGTRKDHDDLYAYYGRISQLEAHSERNRPKVTHMDAVLNIGKINELLGAQYDSMSAVKLEHEKMKARVADLEQANKRKEAELEKHKAEIQKITRAGLFANEVLYKVANGITLQPAESEHLKKLQQQKEAQEKQKARKPHLDPRRPDDLKELMQRAREQYKGQHMPPLELADEIARVYGRQFDPSDPWEHWRRLDPDQKLLSTIRQALERTELARKQGAQPAQERPQTPAQSQNAESQAPKQSSQKQGPDEPEQKRSRGLKR